MHIHCRINHGIVALVSVCRVSLKVQLFYPPKGLPLIM